MKSEVHDALEFCPALPTRAGVAIRLLHLSEQERVDPSELAAVLSEDPSLTLRVLRAANSPGQSGRRRCANMRQAVATLGADATLVLALRFSLYWGDDGDVEQMEHTWARSILSGRAARTLWRHAPLFSEEDLFLPALLLDVGVLALQSSIPEDYASLLRAVGRSHSELALLERQYFGGDHGEAGAWLLSHWGLPDHITDPVRVSHRPEEAAGMSVTTRRAYLCGRIADFLLPGETLSLEDLSQEAERILGLDQETLKVIVRETAQSVPGGGDSVVSPRQAAGIADRAEEVILLRKFSLFRQMEQRHSELEQIEAEARHHEDQSMRDGLTGLRNRRYFDEALPREFDLAAQNEWPLTVALVDLDHFKHVNDTYGHPAGDRVLQKTAGVLKQTLRDNDHIVRYGGEELALILPGLPASAAVHVMERLRLGVADQQYHAEDGTPFRVTASIGVATHSSSEAAYATSEEMLNAADKALYRAKESGRNQVGFAREPGTD